MVSTPGISATAVAEQPHVVGKRKWTPAVLISLKIQRGYLLLMSGMLHYHVLDLAGFIHKL